MTNQFSLLLAVTLGFAAFSSSAEAQAPASFQVVRVNPGPGVKTRTVTMNNMGRAVPLRVEATPSITRADISGVDALTERGKGALRLQFTPDGRKKFAELVRSWRGNQLAIIVDDEVIAAPRTPTSLAGGEILVTGSFTPERGQLLAGAVNAPLEPVAERTAPPRPRARTRR